MLHLIHILYFGATHNRYFDERATRLSLNYYSYLLHGTAVAVAAAAAVVAVVVVAVVVVVVVVVAAAVVYCAVT